MPGLVPPRPLHGVPGETNAVAGLMTLAGGVVVVAALSIARDVLIPIVLAVLLSFLLAPLVNLLRRAWLGRVPAAVLAVFVAHYSKFGRLIYAVGGDEQSATLMGLPVGRGKILIYTVSGFCSALAGVVYTFYTQAGDPASCVGLELDAIAAVVIGGTLLSGGVGFMAGTLMGVLILGLIQTLITFKGDLNTWWTKIVVGGLVLAFILLQNFIALFSTRLRAKK